MSLMIGRDSRCTGMGTDDGNPARPGGIADPSQMQIIMAYANSSLPELRRHGMPEQLIQFIDQNRSTSPRHLHHFAVDDHHVIASTHIESARSVRDWKRTKTPANLQKDLQWRLCKGILTRFGGPVVAASSTGPRQANDFEVRQSVFGYLDSDLDNPFREKFPLFIPGFFTLSLFSTRVQKVEPEQLDLILRKSKWRDKISGLRTLGPRHLVKSLLTKFMASPHSQSAWFGNRTLLIHANITYVINTNTTHESAHCSKVHETLELIDVSGETGLSSSEGWSQTPSRLLRLLVVGEFGSDFRFELEPN
ncbi:hypothetical protein C8R45DRAFT_943517 [Mycena sanguinolenta]|nr:hypothetical protein C8R45DRAFT_943517 [Mycena sanguinolenta]